MDVSETIELELVEIIKETDKAFHLRFNGNHRDWFPKSQCRIFSNKIHIPQWLADKKKIDYLQSDII